MAWSKKWSKSKKRRKQRKFRFQAPLHIKHRFMSASLSKVLRQKLGKRSLPVRTNDTVKIITGEFKKQSGNVTRVDLKKRKVYVEKIIRKKVDGSEVPVALEPSNLRIIELNSEDKKRLKRLKTKKEEKKPEKKKKEVKK